MGLFGKKKENINNTKDMSLQLTAATAKLSKLEDEFRILVKKERNSYANATSKMAKRDAEERLRNAYIQLRLVNVAQDRVYNAASSMQLKACVKELSACLAVINRADAKNHRTIRDMFLEYRAKKMMNAAKPAEEGGKTKSIITDENLESELMAEGVMDQLVNTDIPLARILSEDVDTQDNLDDLNSFCGDNINLFGSDDLSDDLDDLVSKFG